MKKIIIWVIVLVLVIALWAGGFFFLNLKERNPLSKNKIIRDEIENINEKKNPDFEEKELTEEEQLDVLKKRFSLRWTIMKWDSYAENNQLLLALNEYLKAYKESSNDTQIIKKIAWTYFELKKFNQAYEYYKKSESTLNDEEKENLALSIMYWVDFENKTNIKEASEKIKNLNISKDEKIYYVNSISCAINFHSCKKLFWEYSFKEWITYEKLLNIKKAIENYDNFQSENIYYKDALIIWALFQDKLYNVSSYLWKNLLKSYPNYKPILLIIWKWEYEIWDTKEAKEYLTQYFNLDQKDLNVNYLLWDINFKLRDYISSNIYYNNALQNWFTPKIELQRKLIYNYYLIWDKRWMLRIFSYLLDENDANINDFSLWIYHAILEWRKDEARKWSERWIKKFEKQTWYEVFYWYLWWLERESRNFTRAWEYLLEWLAINPRNPLLTLNYWYLEETRENYPKALVYFKRTQIVNWEWEFWELAQKEIELIEKHLEEQKIIEKKLQQKTNL